LNIALNGIWFGAIFLFALGIEALLELFLCCCTYATQKSDCQKPDPWV